MAASGSMAAASSSFVSVGLLVLMNVVASVSLVGVNKLLVVGFNFRHVLLLSGLHFGVGWAALQGASSADLPASARLFERKVPAWRLVLPSAAAGALSIVLMNYSLRTNSLGSYQMLKVAVLPATIALAAVQGTAVSTADVGAAALVSAGTAVATVTDVDLSAAGSAVGLAAVAATAQYQVACGRVQTDFGLSSAQALHALSAPQAVLTLVAALLLETDWTARLAAARGGGAMLRGGALEADGAGAGAGLPPARARHECLLDLLRGLKAIPQDSGARRVAVEAVDRALVVALADGALVGLPAASQFGFCLTALKLHDTMASGYTCPALFHALLPPLRALFAAPPQTPLDVMDVLELSWRMCKLDAVEIGRAHV
jgi:hypothetical protein